MTIAWFTWKVSTLEVPFLVPYRVIRTIIRVSYGDIYSSNSGAKPFELKPFLYQNIVAHNKFQIDTIGSLRERRQQKQRSDHVVLPHSTKDIIVKWIKMWNLLWEQFHRLFWYYNKLAPVQSPYWYRNCIFRHLKHNLVYFRFLKHIKHHLHNWLWIITYDS